LLRLVAKCQVGLPSLAQFLAIPRPGRRLALHTAPGLCSAPRGIVSAPLPVATPSRASVKPFSRPKYSRSITRDMHYYSGSVAMGATAPCIGIDERDEDDDTRRATAQLSPRNRLCPTTDWPGYPTIALLFPSRARGIITEFTHATRYSTLFSRGNLIGARKFTSLFTKLFFFHRKEKLVLQISPTRILFSHSLSVTGGISVTTARKGSRSKSVISCR
jgi:hypothetical protein